VNLQWLDLRHARRVKALDRSLAEAEISAHQSLVEGSAVTSARRKRESDLCEVIANFTYL